MKSIKLAGLNHDPLAKTTPWLLMALAVIITSLVAGCNKSASDPDSLIEAVPAESQPGGIGAGEGTEEIEAGFAPPLNIGGRRDRDASRPNEPSPGSPSRAPAGNQLGGNPMGNSGLGDSAATIASELQLPAETNREQLVQFLGDVDREIQRLGTSPTAAQNRDALVAEIKRIAVLKQEAAERLLAAADTEPELREIATRARMQAFSHRAAFGDLQAAEALEQFATESVSHPSAEIARDSRTILLGFALERLQGGVTTEPTEVLRLVEDLTNNSMNLNASSAKVMQRAMIILNQYGYSEAAESVRKSIEVAFANTDDPNLAELIADVLAAARFNILESMRAEIYQSAGQTPEEWGRQAELVAGNNRDLMTLQYLASLALQLEAVGRIPAANTVYGPIEQYFAKSDDQTLATAASEAIDGFEIRQKAIGTSVSFDSPTTLSGKALPVNYVSDKIVLMPFWSIEQFDSVAPLGGLEQIASANPGRIAILGVNMDVTPIGRSKAQELASYEMPWPNLVAVEQSGVDQVIGNPFVSPLAKRFGVVSLPTVVVLDQQGRIAAIALGPPAIQQAVQKLLLP